MRYVARVTGVRGYANPNNHISRGVPVSRWLGKELVRRPNKELVIGQFTFFGEGNSPLPLQTPLQTSPINFMGDTAAALPQIRAATLPPAVEKMKGKRALPQDGGETKDDGGDNDDDTDVEETLLLLDFPELVGSEMLLNPDQDIVVHGIDAGGKSISGMTGEVVVGGGHIFMCYDRKLHFHVL
jgi:hypothetical protein